jgi:hypothetical protein
MRLTNPYLRRQATRALGGMDEASGVFGTLCGGYRQSDQLLLQFVGQGVQAWKEMAVHGFQRRAFAMDADIQCGDDSSVALL